MTIAVDFDGVIHQYSRGWQDGAIYDPPAHGAVEGLRALMAEHAVYIHTAREPEQVMPWLERLGFDVTIDERCGRCLGEMYTLDSPDPPCSRCGGSGRLEFWDVRGQLLVTDRKLPATHYVDDRGVRFHQWDQLLAELGICTHPQPRGNAAELEFGDPASSDRVERLAAMLRSTGFDRGGNWQRDRYRVLAGQVLAFLACDQCVPDDPGGVV